jgi:uncharacterized small protein (DUF1192 family)
MYRINLYPEFVQKRAQRRRRLLRTTLVAVVTALDAALVVTLVMTGVLLAERTSRLKDEVARLDAALQRASQPQPAADAARELLEIRRGRLDWTPKLAACGEAIDSMLLLTGMDARSAGRGGEARLEVTGLLCGTPPDVQAVPRYMEALRADPRIRENFSEVQLGTMEGGADGRFRISCQTPRKSEGS